MAHRYRIVQRATERFYVEKKGWFRWKAITWYTTLERAEAFLTELQFIMKPVVIREYALTQEEIE